MLKREASQMSDMLYLEDLRVGQTMRSGTVRVDAEDIKAFASKFDPQPFHLDEQAAAQSFFGGLVASGWHTAALTMRLLVESDLKIAGGLIGAGVQEIRWPRPVRPGDILQVESEILAVRPSNSRTDRGIATMRAITRNQDELPVAEMITNVIVPRRPAKP